MGVVVYPQTTYNFGHPTKQEIEQTICIHGYLGRRHDISKSLSFTQLFDKSLQRSIQVVSTSKNQSSNTAHAKIKTLNIHSAVAVKGRLTRKQGSKKHSSNNESQSLTTTSQSTSRTKDVSRASRSGSMNDSALNEEDYEVQLEDIQLLNEFPKDIIVQEETNIPLEQRHLQFRQSAQLREVLKQRAEIAHRCREILRKADYVEIDTPQLVKSTPEGAREFLVPSRKKGAVYALPQSPQQYKQILMASGFTKYFQLARCFRDEDLRADRQPEFTQLDLEVSWISPEMFRAEVESLIESLWRENQDGHAKVMPVRQMTYNEAMSKYGSDKPDLRLGMEISRIDHVIPPDLVTKISSLTLPSVDYMKLSVSDNPAETRKFITKFMDSSEGEPFRSNPDGQPGLFVVDSSKPMNGLSAFGWEAAQQLEDEHDLKDGDLVVLQARPRSEQFTGGSTVMGNLRLAIHKAAVRDGLIPAPKGWEFLWIVDFPLFSPISSHISTSSDDPGQGGMAGLKSTHHPFTAPKTPEDVDKLLTNPLSVVADHYDLVVNGVELGGGSRRIHHAGVQELILRDVLKMPDERVQDFRHLLEVLRAGCPPHCGFALGFDRLVAMMLGYDSVRDVIAFPKNGSGEDPLVGAPSKVTQAQLETYFLRLVD
jgi:aspartyl-tRNA synthetase